MIQFSSLEGNRQKLDGGAMFGNAPKAIWKKWITPDEDNRIELACRALLVESHDTKVLIETGIGAYMEPKLKERFGVTPDHHQLLESMENLKVDPEEITHVILTHLHFDHAGGLLNSWDNPDKETLLFPNATYFVSQTQWERANTPHPRDRASYIPRLLFLLESSGRLERISLDRQLEFDGFTIRFFESNGHTPGMMCPIIKTGSTTLIFPADLIPGCPWVHLPITMGYDRFPEQLIDEKREILTFALEQEAFLFFTHDPHTSLIKVGRQDSGRFVPIPKHKEITRNALMSRG